MVDSTSALSHRWLVRRRLVSLGCWLPAGLPRLLGFPVGLPSAAWLPPSGSRITRRCFSRSFPRFSPYLTQLFLIEPHVGRQFVAGGIYSTSWLATVELRFSPSRDYLCGVDVVNN